MHGQQNIKKCVYGFFLIFLNFDGKNPLLNFVQAF